VKPRPPPPDLADAAPVMIWVQETDGTHSFFNRVWLQFTGRTLEDEVGDGWTQGIHPEDRKRWLDISTRSFDAHIPFRIDGRLRRRDGEFRWIFLTGMPRFGDDGAFQGFIGSAIDITDRRSSEDQTKQNRFFLEKAEEVAHVGYWVSDLAGDGKLVWSRETYRIFGLDESSFDGRVETFFSRVHPEDLAFVKDESQAAAEGRRPYDVEHRIVRPDGALRWVHQRAEIERDSAKKPVRMIGVCQDITGRKLAEEALRGSEERFRLMADHINEVFWMIDPERRRMYYVSPGYERIWGRPVASLLADPATWFDAIHPDDRARALKALPPNQTQEAYGEAYRIIRPDGSAVWILDRGWPVKDRAGNVYRFVGTALDISDLKRTEEEMLLRAKELARSNEELERFAYAASHDLQEPLRMVSSYVQLIKRRYQGKLDANADEFIRYAAEGAHRMQALIQDLLAYSRVDIKPATVRPVPLNSVVDNALANLEVLAREAGAVVTRGELPTVSGQPTLLTQAFQNLIHNAIKFRDQRPPEIKITAERRGKEWVISVADNGIGIDPAYHPRLFILFQRLHTRDRFQGSGLGLALCKKIVERHGGRIWVESETGKGSTFRVALPASDGLAG